jgi:integrase
LAARLTDISVKNVKAGETRQEIPDGGCKGLYLIVQPSGKKSWAVRYRHEGKPRKLTLDGFPPLATARKLATEAIENPERDAAAEKKANKTAAKVDAERHTFPKVVETYLRHYAEGRATRKKSKPKERTVAETKRTLDRLADDSVWGKKAMRQITKNDVIELLDGIVDRGAPVMANRTYMAILPLFAWAVRRDIIPASPVVWDKLAEQSRERALTADEIKLFWKATETLGHPFKSVFRLLLLTGQRRAEVADMQASELDLENSVWTLPASRTKNGREHAVPLSDKAKAILEEAPRIASPDGYIFTTNGKTPPSGFSKAVAAMRKKMDELAGEPIPSWSLHDLRRTVSTVMNDDELAIDPHVVEVVLNHVSGARAGVAGTYNKAAYVARKRSALNAWTNYVLTLIGERQTDNVTPFRAAQ